VRNTDRNDPRQEENVGATANLAASAIKVGARAFVATGSQAEYGPLNRIVLESDPLNPTTLYGRAKCAARTTAQQICAEVRFAWLRVFSLYGPNDNESWLIPSLIDALSKGKSPKLTAGEQLWDFLYVADAAAAIVAVLETQTASGDFNLGSGVALPLRQAIETIRDIVSPRTALTFGEIPYRPDQVMHLQADITRLRAAVGWSPTTDFREGVKETIRRQRRAEGRVGWA
jgi:nucleoside-diphosphate-sugar epimerase